MIAAGTIACGAPPEEVLDSSPALQRVRPRVVLDGLIELSARTEGRIFVDEVLIHAPDVELLDHGQSTDVLASDPTDDGPLLFRYSADTSAAGASASAHQRTWDLSDFGRSPDSALLFSFAPFAADQDMLEELEARVGYEVSGLTGYTALVSGYVAVDISAPSEGLGSGNDGLHFTASGDPDGAPASGDPDGAPALGTKDDAASGDPDGAPASGDPDGAPASGDPDGAPASGDPDGAPASGDPDGAPASGDPDGAPASGDPDGAPANGGDDDDDDDDDAVDPDDDSTPVDMEHLAGSGDPDGAPAAGDPDAPADSRASHRGESSMSGSLGPNGDHTHVERELRPFVIVFDSRFDLKIPAASVLHKDLQTDDGRRRLVPIDLHVDTDSLFSERVLELLEAVNDEHSDASVPAIVVLDDYETASFNVEAENPYEIPDEQQGGGNGNPLMVTGDRRGNDG